MGRTSDAKEKIISAAQSLIELRGYSASGVAEICKTAGVQVDMVDSVITEALQRDEVVVADTREAARSVVVQLEGQTLFAKLYDNTSQLSTLWANCMALLGARAPQEAAASER
jgi:TetR/AcrR family transcriptional repressor of nem operon